MRKRETEKQEWLKGLPSYRIDREDGQVIAATFKGRGSLIYGHSKSPHNYGHSGGGGGTPTFENGGSLKG